MTEGDAAAEAALRHRLHDHRRENLVRLKVLVDVEVDWQDRLLGEIEQRGGGAFGVGAGIDAQSEEIGLERDGGPEPRDRLRFGEIVTRGRERDHIDIDLSGHRTLRRQHALH